jgi:hypothetical protein
LVQRRAGKHVSDGSSQESKPGYGRPPLTGQAGAIYKMTGDLLQSGGRI